MPNSKGQRQDTRHKLSNSARSRGASPPSHAVREFSEGDKVHVDIDPSVPEGRPHPKFQGHTGEVTGKQGRALRVRVNDQGNHKQLVVRPQHLRPQE